MAKVTVGAFKDNKYEPQQLHCACTPATLNFNGQAGRVIVSSQATWFNVTYS